MSWPCALQAVNSFGTSAPALSFVSTLPLTNDAPSSVTPTGPSFTAVGVSSTIRMTSSSLAVLPPTPSTLTVTLSSKWLPVASV
ncbi:hypothetical protein D3C85_1053340 [compost metagenome]